MGYPITTPHSRNPLAGVGGDQLQPGVEDGGTPTEVVVGEYWGRGITSTHLIPRILWRECVVISYNQE